MGAAAAAAGSLHLAGRPPLRACAGASWHPNHQLEVLAFLLLLPVNPEGESKGIQLKVRVLLWATGWCVDTAVRRPGRGGGGGSCGRGLQLTAGSAGSHFSLAAGHVWPWQCKQPGGKSQIHWP